MGSFDDSLASRYQMALLVLMVEALRLDQLELECVEFFDPSFTPADTRVIEHHYGLAVVSRNERATRPVSSPTIFYMPHCPKALYNNLLYANWSHDRLANLIIFGNSFSHLQQTIVDVDSRIYTYLVDSFELLDEVEVASDSEPTNAFVDLSFNLFRERAGVRHNELRPTYDIDSLKPPFYSNCEEII